MPATPGHPLPWPGVVVCAPTLALARVGVDRSNGQLQNPNGRVTGPNA